MVCFIAICLPLISGLDYKQSKVFDLSSVDLVTPLQYVGVIPYADATPATSDEVALNCFTMFFLIQ